MQTRNTHSYTIYHLLYGCTKTTRRFRLTMHKNKCVEFIYLFFCFSDGLKCWSMFCLDLGLLSVCCNCFEHHHDFRIRLFEVASNTDAHTIHFDFVCSIQYTKVIRISVYCMSFCPERTNRKSFTICTLFFRCYSCCCLFRFFFFYGSLTFHLIELPQLFIFNIEHYTYQMHTSFISLFHLSQLICVKHE